MVARRAAILRVWGARPSPWAWAINGCASVTGSVLTIALAMTFGFARVWAASVVIYALGVVCFLISQRITLRAASAVATS